MAPKKSRKKAKKVAKSKRRQPQAHAHFQGGGDAGAAGFGAAAIDERRWEDEGEAEELCKRGDRYLTGNGVTQDYGEAVRCYRQAAQMGHEQAQFNLGECYAQGTGVPQDFAEAACWYRLSGDHGDAMAQCNLAILHDRREMGFRRTFGKRRDFTNWLRMLVTRKHISTWVTATVLEKVLSKTMSRRNVFMSLLLLKTTPPPLLLSVDFI